MSATALIRARPRICSTISRICNRRFSSSTTLSASSQAPGTEKKSWSFLKYGLLAALTGGAATAGYATYAYSLDEVDNKTKSMRAYTSYFAEKDASALDKFQGTVFSAAMKVTAKLVDVYLDLRRLAEDQIRDYAEPSSNKLLPDLHPMEQHVFTLVLDLNETLIYSEWQRERGWSTFKRPGIDAFLEHLAQFYEVVVFSDQLNAYVDPVVERLDPKHCIRYKLSRGDTRYVNGKHYKDFSMLNRDPSKVIYVSAHAADSSLQPENSVQIPTWTGEATDTALLDLIPFLEYVAKARPADIRTVLASYQGCDIAKEFIERSKEHMRRQQEQKQRGRLWRI